MKPTPHTQSVKTIVHMSFTWCNCTFCRPSPNHTHVKRRNTKHNQANTETLSQQSRRIIIRQASKHMRLVSSYSVCYVARKAFPEEYRTSKHFGLRSWAFGFILNQQAGQQQASQPASKPTRQPVSKPASKPASKPDSKPARQPTREPASKQTIQQKKL